MKNGIIVLCLLLSCLLCSCSSNAPSTGEAPVTPSSATPMETTVPLPVVAKVPKATGELVGQNFSDVVYLFKGAGFTNIQTELFEDLTSATKEDDGKVFTVLLDQQSQFSAGEEFPINTPVTIRYHHLKTIPLPLSATEAKGKNYLTVAQQLAQCGFYNISTDEIYTDNPPETTIVVSGYEKIEKDQQIPFDTPIVVTGMLAQRKYDVSITIDFDPNWILDRHDIAFAVNGGKASVLEHGNDGTFTYQLPAGDHQITVTSQENSAATATLTLTVNSDTQATYHVKTHSKTIDFSQKQLTQQLQNNQISLAKSAGYYLRKNYSDCIAALKLEGFTSFSVKTTTAGLWGKTPAGAIISISIDGKTNFAHGDIFSQNAPVVITYHVPELETFPKTIACIEGDTFTIPYAVSENDHLQDVSLVVEDPAILAQSEDGAFTAAAVGTTNILAKFEDHTLAKCAVTVELKKIYLESITLPEPSITVSAGSVFLPQFTYTPADANQLVLDTAFTGDLLERLPDGSLYAAGTGDVLVTLSQNGKQLGVLQVQIVDIPIEKISFDQADLSVYLNHTAEFSFTLVPENASRLFLSATVENEEIATVEYNEKGPQVIKITGVSIGKTKLHIQETEGVSVTKEIIVTEVPPTEIAVTANAPVLQPEHTGKATAAFAPNDVTNKAVTWKSSDPKIVKIKEDGSYEALKPGTVTITATHKSGLTGTCEITVQPIPVETVTIAYNSDQTEDFKMKEKTQLTAEVYPFNATDKTITWSSSDPSVATVSKKGLVTGVSVGDVIITATAQNGKKSELTIHVAAAPMKFKVTYTLTRKSTNHVGNNWRKGVEFNDKSIKSGAKISVLPGKDFSICAWAEERDSSTDYGCFYKNITLTADLYKGFTLEDDFYVEEDRGRYSGNEARWHVKIKFTPVN